MNGKAARVRWPARSYCWRILHSDHSVVTVDLPSEPQ
jgi:hypothetical protein